jgi:putative N6-adenine-specific DNA methylase
MSRWVTIEQKDVGTLSAPMSGSLIVCNPPYGRRMSEVNALRGLYRKLGARLKSHATGCTAWVLLGEPRLGRELGMRPAETIPLYNGPIECSLARYDLKATSDAEEGSR